jgi:hypothetical protein
MKGMRLLRDNIRRALEVSIEDVVLELMKQHKGVLIRLNQDQLLLEGIDADGKKLAPYRSENYAARKRLLNPAGVTDLRLTGKFYAGFFVTVEDFPLIFGSTDSKTDKLIEKYGEKIFGLTEESKRYFMDNYLKEALLQYYKRLLRL